jgi:hypothetical protein
MPENILFYFVFLSQVVLISFYYPKEILGRITFVLQKYPMDTYPKLYPKTIEFYEKGKLIYRITNQIIFVLGFILMFAVGMWDYSSDGNIPEMFPFVYWVFQVLPILLMEISGFAYFKLMRKADVRTTRKAGLQPRRLFDFVSPTVVGLAIFSNIACVLFFFSIHQFHFHLSNDTFVILITLVASNLLYAAIIFWNLYGKKLDPHQSAKDRTRQIKVTIKSLVFMSMGASLFLTIFESVDKFHLDYLEPVLMSVYLQFVILIGLGSLLRNLRIENVDFDVYKTDASAS